MSNVKNMYNTEASLKYFIVQVLASATLLFIVVIKTLTEDLFTFETFAVRSQPVYCAAVYRERRYQMLCEYNFSS